MVTYYKTMFSYINFNPENIMDILKNEFNATEPEKLLKFSEWLSDFCKKNNYSEENIVKEIYEKILVLGLSDYYSLFNINNKNTIVSFIHLISNVNDKILTNFFDNILNDENKLLFLKSSILCHLHSYKNNSSEYANNNPLLLSSLSQFLLLNNENEQNGLINYCLYTDKESSNINFEYIKLLDSDYFKKITENNKQKLIIDDLYNNLELLKKENVFNPQQIINLYKKHLSKSKNYNFSLPINIILNDFSIDEILHQDITGEGTILHLMIKNEEHTKFEHEVKKWMTEKKINLNILDKDNNSLYQLLVNHSINSKDFLWWGLMSGGEPLLKNKAGEFPLTNFEDFEQPLVLDFLKNKIHLHLHKEKDKKTEVQKKRL